MIEEVEDMMSNTKLRPILDALNKVSTTANDRNIDLERNLMKEARGLRDKTKESEGTTDVFWNKRPKDILDLDVLK